MFCHDLYSNIQTHIENKNANKKEVQEIKTRKQKKEFCNTKKKTDFMKEINRKVTLIRNKGDNIHDMSVLQKGGIQLEKSVANHRTSCPAFKTGSDYHGPPKHGFKNWV